MAVSEQLCFSKATAIISIEQKQTKTHKQTKKKDSIS